MPNYTLALSEDTARRMRELTQVLGGSVGGFAAGLASDVSRLPPEEIVRIRQEINARVRIHEADTTTRKKVA